MICFSCIRTAYRRIRSHFLCIGFNFELITDIFWRIDFNINISSSPLHNKNDTAYRKFDAAFILCGK